MPTNRIKIDVPGPGTSRAVIEVDGHRLRGVVGVDVKIEARNAPPTVTVTLLASVVEMTLAGARLHLDDRIHQSMLILGWTPPPDGADTEALADPRGLGDPQD